MKVITKDKESGTCFSEIKPGECFIDDIVGNDNSIEIKIDIDHLPVNVLLTLNNGCHESGLSLSLNDGNVNWYPPDHLVRKIEAEARET